MAATVNIEVKAEIEQALRGLQQINGVFGDMRHVNQDAAGALGVFGVSLTALNNPLTAVATGIKDSIDTTLKWADEMDKLSRNTGMTTQAASKMAVIFGDFGISAGQTTIAVKTLNKEGLSLNIDTLKLLSHEYQSIKDPVERLQFATKNFGRAAQDMTEILSKTPAEFDALSAAADRSGKIMTAEGVEKAQKFKLELAQLNDMVEGVKINIGGPLIDTLHSAGVAFDDLTKTLQLLELQRRRDTDTSTAWGLELNKGTTAIDAQTAALKAQEIVNGGVTDAVKILGDAEDKQIDRTYRASDGYATMTDSMWKSLAPYDPLTTATQAQNEALALQDSMTGKLTASMIFQAAAAGETTAAQIALAKGLGLMDDATFTAIEKTTSLKAQFDAGTISLGNYVYQLGLIKNGLDGLNDKVVNVTVNTHYQTFGDENFGGAGSGYTPPPPPGGWGDGTAGAQGGAQ